MISENSRKHYSAHVPHSKALNCTNDYVELYTSLCSQLGLRPNTAVGVSLRQYEVNTCMDSLSEMDVVPLAALLAKARLLTSVQFWGKKFQMAVQQPELSVCVSTPGGSLPTTSRSRDKLEYARRTYKFPNEQDKSLSEIHEDPGTVCNSRNIEQTIKLMKGLSRNLQTGGILRQLRLVGLKFGKESVNQLAEGLKDNRSLDYLCINYCRLTDKRFAVLANSLCTAVKLRKLDLAHNDLEDLCGFHLGRMIGKNAERKDEAVWAYGLRGEQLALDLDEGLQDVCLANNKVSDRDIFDLGRVLYCDAYMRVLDLRRNRLSPQGINEVLSIVASNNSLLMVDIRENALEERSEDFLKVGYKITTKLMRNLKTLKSSGVAMNPDWEAKLSEYQIAYFSPSESAIEHRVFSKRKDTPKQSSGSSAPRISPQNIYIDDVPYEDLAGSNPSESPLPLKPQLGSPHPPLHQKKVEESAASPCSKCREYERVLYKTESNCVALTLENNQLKSALKTATTAVPPRPVQHSWSSISNPDTHTYLPPGESISMTGYSSQKQVQGGTGEETESGVLHRIEIMMSELTRLMDTLELSHRAPPLHPTASESFSPSRTQVIAP